MILLMSRTGSNLFSRVDGVGESDRNVDRPKLRIVPPGP